jgi:hypothetical protein
MNITILIGDPLSITTLLYATLFYCITNILLYATTTLPLITLPLTPRLPLRMLSHLHGTWDT